MRARYPRTPKTPGIPHARTPIADPIRPQKRRPDSPNEPSNDESLRTTKGATTREEERRQQRALKSPHSPITPRPSPPCARRRVVHCARRDA